MFEVFTPAKVSSVGREPFLSVPHGPRRRGSMSMNGVDVQSTRCIRRPQKKKQKHLFTFVVFDSQRLGEPV
jgi:hypothetical protein